MSKKEVIQFFKKRIEEAVSEQQLIRGRQRSNSWIRLLVFVLSIAIATYLIRNGYQGPGIAAVILGLIGFMFLVAHSSKLEAALTKAETIADINEDELARLAGSWEHMDTGKEFEIPDHPYSADLDLFRKNGLFGLLNRSATHGGRRFIANWLNSCIPEQEILSRQEAVKELSQNPLWRQDFEVAGLCSGESGNELEELLNWLKDGDAVEGIPSALNYIRFISPLVTMAVLIICWQGILPWNVYALFVILQLSIVGFYLKRINQVHKQITLRSVLLERFMELFIKVEEGSWQSSRLRDLQQLLQEDTKASKAIDQLSVISKRIDFRLNMLMGTVLNALFLFDFHMLFSLQKWQDRFRLAPGRWFMALWEVDCLQSLAGYAFTKPEHVYPTISAEDQSPFKAIDISHPLMVDIECIGNDIEIPKLGHLHLVTGSNMAGKSTFLRTIGVNLVLAMAGVPVSAREMRFRTMPIYTSMRVMDNLQERESTFYAELKRLRLIIEAASGPEPIFILLDEILKGTNSKDKLHGSEALIEQLIGYNTIGLIATHDLVLGEMEARYPHNLKNVHFDVDIENDQFAFDYKLKSGICTTMNATQLMKKMGISVKERNSPN